MLRCCSNKRHSAVLLVLSLNKLVPAAKRKDLVFGMGAASVEVWFPSFQQGFMGKGASGCTEGQRKRQPGCQHSSSQPRQGSPHILQNPTLIHFTAFTFTPLNATKPSN